MMDWTEKNLCIKCNEGANLLVCSENGCPLAVHEGCMGRSARYDDVGNFYCPYCLYKKAVAESRQAREYALERKKALLAFMDEDVVGRETPSELNKGAEANGHDQSKSREANIYITTNGGDKIFRNSGSIGEQSIHLDEEDEIRGEEDGKTQEEEIEACAGPKCQDSSVQMSGEQKIGNEKENEDEEHEASAASSSQEKGIQNAEEEKDEEERETSCGSSDQDSLPLRERAKRALKSRMSIDADFEAVSVKSKPDEESNKKKLTAPNVNTPRRSSRRLSCSLRVEEGMNEEVSVSKKLKQPEKVEVSKRLKKNELPIVKLPNDTYSSGKRKRLLWSDEEEEMLKAGVEKHSEGLSRIPWSEILEMGCNVFDRTRTPVDLKDKWRTMSRT